MWTLCHRRWSASRCTTLVPDPLLSPEAGELFLAIHDDFFLPGASVTEVFVFLLQCAALREGSKYEFVDKVIKKS